MTDWKSCGNCSDADCPWCGDGAACNMWKPIPCPYCGGAMSEIREHNGRRYRHCYSCHMEPEVKEE